MNDSEPKDDLWSNPKVDENGTVVPSGQLAINNSLLDPDTKMTFETYRQQMDKSLKMRDERNIRLARSVSMIADSTRIHEEGIEYLKMHLLGTDEQINQNTVSIAGLEEKTEVIKVDVANFHEQYERESKDFRQRVTKSMVSTAMHLKTHDEQIATHSNIISGLVLNTEQLTGKFDQLQTNSNVTCAQGKRVKSVRINTESFKALGIVYDESERFHPHSFIQAFEGQLRGIAIEEAYKCNLFISLVQTKGARSWVKHQRNTVKSFNVLVQRFYREFWSRSSQERAWIHFNNELVYVESNRDMLRTIVRWIGTLRLLERYTQKEIMIAIRGKLPSEYASKISTRDCKTYDILIKKLEKLEEHEDTIIKPKKMMCHESRSETGAPVSSRSYSAPRTPNHSSNESRFSYRDRYQQTPTQDYKKPENSKTKSEDFKEHEYRRSRHENSQGKKIEAYLNGQRNEEEEFKTQEIPTSFQKTPRQVAKEIADVLRDQRQSKRAADESDVVPSTSSAGSNEDKENAENAHEVPPATKPTIFDPPTAKRKRGRPHKEEKYPNSVP
ncbi:hypothetical protein U1Q18_048295 [Sarracenia purpurea var. burkii]